jgi:hypothetical protein
MGVRGQTSANVLQGRRDRHRIENGHHPVSRRAPFLAGPDRIVTAQGAKSFQRIDQADRPVGCRSSSAPTAQSISLRSSPGTTGASSDGFNSEKVPVTLSLHGGLVRPGR